MPQLTKHLIPRIKLFQLLDSVSIDDQTAAESWVICSSVVLKQELENGASKKKKGCSCNAYNIYIPATKMKPEMSFDMCIYASANCNFGLLQCKIIMQLVWRHNLTGNSQTWF